MRYINKFRRYNNNLLLSKLMNKNFKNNDSQPTTQPSMRQSVQSNTQPKCKYEPNDETSELYGVVFIWSSTIFCSTIGGVIVKLLFDDY